MNRTQVTDLITRYNGNRGISVEVIYDYGCSDTLIDPSHVCGENYGVAVLSADGRQSTYDFTLALQCIADTGVDTTPSTPLAQYSVKHARHVCSGNCVDGIQQPRFDGDDAIKCYCHCHVPLPNSEIADVLYDSQRVNHFEFTVGYACENINPYTVKVTTRAQIIVQAILEYAGYIVTIINPHTVHVTR